MAGAPRIDSDEIHAELYAELLALPEHVTGEIIAGELFASPRPAVAHARAATRVTTRIAGAYDEPNDVGPGGWIILVEPELHLGQDVLVPDIAGWRVERLPNPRDLVAIDVAPDWVCEIASPSTAHRDRGVKRDAYAHAGVAWLWLVDPAAETLEAFELRGERWLLVGTWTGDTTVRVPPFEAAEIVLAHVWGRAAASEAEPESGPVER